MDGNFICLLLVLARMSASDEIPVAPVEGDIRLKDGPTPFEGRAEMYVNGTWGTMCDNDFVARGWPSVFCKQLGYKVSTSAAHVRVKGLSTPQNLPIARQSSICNPGTANTMAECSVEIAEECGHDQDLFIVCQGTKPKEGDIRLQNGSTSFEGRAEMFVNGAWGSICDQVLKSNGWPSVFCKQLRHGAPVSVDYTREMDLPTPQNLAIARQSPVCNTSNRKTMAECGTDVNLKCAHDKDVYVTCQETQAEEGDVRLQDGSTSYEGRAEMYVNDTWGSICDYNVVVLGWPSVLCTLLGHGAAASIAYTGQMGLQTPQNLSVARKGVSCNLTTMVTTMADCGMNLDPRCGHDQDVYIVCQGPDKPEKASAASGPNMTAAIVGGLVCAVLLAIIRECHCGCGL